MLLKIFYSIAVLLAAHGVGPVAEQVQVPLSYDEYVELFHEMVEDEGVEAALARLEEETLVSDTALTYCHGLVHEIGHSAYEYYGFEDALLFEEDLCGAGYLHGMVEEYLADQADIEAALQSTCDLGDAVCIHGLGHGLMIHTENNVDQSLSYCDTFANQADKIYCAEGVFMENFNLDLSIHSSDFLKMEDPFYPCSEQDSLYKGTCYFYASRFYNHLYPEQYEEALDWCMTAEYGFVADCVRGVGSTTMKLNMDEVKFVESVCMTAGEEYVPFCIYGMTSYYIVNYASSGKGELMCAVLEEGDNQKACMEKVESMSAYYSD